MSTAFTEEQARAYMHKLLAAMSQAGGSDLFISNDFPPSMKAQGAMKPLTSQKLTGEVTRMLAHSLMNERQRDEFAKEMECNFAISIPGVSRFRVNVFVQQQLRRHGDPHHRHRDPELREAEAARDRSRKSS